MNAGERGIYQTALDVMEGKHPSITAKRGACLAFVRRVIEAAFGWNDGEFYDRLGTHRTTAAVPNRADLSWWAADIERSLREGGLGHTPGEGGYILPGVLVFSHQLGKPYGHVAVYMGNGFVLEAIDPAHRPRSLMRGDLALSSLGAWPQPPTLYAYVEATSRLQMKGPS